MINIDAHLIETATKVTISRNEAGDTLYGATSQSACLYRDISSLSSRQQMEYANMDGLLWFGASENVSRGDVYYHSSEGYLRIERIVRAKRLVADNSLQFIKCEVTRQRQIS